MILFILFFLLIHTKDTRDKQSKDKSPAVPFFRVFEVLLNIFFQTEEQYLFLSMFWIHFVQNDFCCPFRSIPSDTGTLIDMSTSFLKRLIFLFI